MECNKVDQERLSVRSASDKNVLTPVKGVINELANCLRVTFSFLSCGFFLSHPPLEPCVAAAQTHVCELQQFWVNQEEGN